MLFETLNYVTPSPTVSNPDIIFQFHVTYSKYHIQMVFLILIFVQYATAIIYRRPPTIHDIQISDSTAKHMVSRINKLLIKMYKISCGEELTRFFVVCNNGLYPSKLHIELTPHILLCSFLHCFQTLASLWVLSIFGSYSSALNVLYVGKFLPMSRSIIRQVFTLKMWIQHYTFNAVNLVNWLDLII